MTEYDTIERRLSVFGKKLLILCVLVSLFLLPQKIFSQDVVFAIPEALRMPDRGEASRFAMDFVIGELGRGEASEGAYLFAAGLLSAITNWRSGEGLPERYRSAVTEGTLQEIRSINARTYRLGGGKAEADGSVSFLTRIIGQEESITGELFLRYANESWLVDDLLLEEKRSLSEIRDGYKYNFSPYERFF